MVTSMKEEGARSEVYCNCWIHPSIHVLGVFAFRGYFRKFEVFYLLVECCLGCPRDCKVGLQN